MDINEILKRSEYKSLIGENSLNKNDIMFLTYGGSYAYGTNCETSDIDIRGVCFNAKSDLIGTTNFEQIDSNETDTVIFVFNKFIKLISNCNPNTIEMLGCRKESYAMVHPLGKQLIDNRKMFLSKKAKYSFGGYANQQLRRLYNNLSRFSVPQEEKEKYMLSSCNNSILGFADRYQSIKDGTFELSLEDSKKENMSKEVCVTCNLEKYPLRDCKNMLSDMYKIINEFDKLNKRNTKKDNIHMCKHVMHLVRLYLTAIDLFEQGDIITYREKDHDLLMDIRNGKFQTSDGTYDEELNDFINELEKRFDYAYNNSSLPDSPNYKMINEFVMDVNKRVVNDNI